MQMPRGDERQAAIAAAMRLWSRDHFEDAVTWAGQLPDAAERQSAEESAAFEQARIDPFKALNLASTLKATARRDEIIMRAATEWTLIAPDAASSWADSIADDALRCQVISGVALTLADREPLSAANLAVDRLPPGPLQDKVVLGIVQRWGLTNPNAATAWVAGFPEGSLRDAARGALEEYSKR